MNTPDWATVRAETLVRLVITPDYPIDKSISEMTTYEQCYFRRWVPPIAVMLREERERCAEKAKSYLGNIGFTNCEVIAEAIRSGR